MRTGSLLLSTVLAVGAALPTAALAGPPDRQDRPLSDRAFQRVAHFPVYLNNADPSEATVAEIVDATPDGRTLVYTDAEQEQIGFVDITDPAAPAPAGTLEFEGEPTSVAVTGAFALVGVNTTEDLTAPSGHLAVVDVAARELVAELPLAGQPDSVAVSPDAEYAAVVIENERDEDVTVGGVEGGLPQAPAGLLQVVDLAGAPATWSLRTVDLTGLAQYAAEDPEPEFVDIDNDGRAVVTLQENNHLVVVDLPSGTVVSDFSAGTVDLDQVDTVEDDFISLTGSLTGVRREPDGVSWVVGGLLATANEGDLFGGSRGFTIFNADGGVVYDSGNSFEQELARAGHYPESRSENKGGEVEGVEVGRFGNTTYLFVGAERANVVGVYEVRGASRPRFVQLLPAGMGPEGLKAIPSRNLVVATSEEDDPTFGVRANISIYRLTDDAPAYPQIASEDDSTGTPVPWSALSGLVADPARPGVVYAVSDSYYTPGQIFTVDTTRTPAVITDVRPVTGAGGLDLEGVTIAPDGDLWLASEGDAADSRPNRLLRVDSGGHVVEEVGLPDEILDCRAAGGATATGSGFEGVTAVPTDDGYVLAVAQQRGWEYTTPECAALGDAPGYTRVWFYDPVTGAWTHQSYQLQPTPANASWVGLSEITLLEDGEFMLIERDNRTGAWAQLKALTKVDLSMPVANADKQNADLLAPLRASNGWVTDKPEGATVLPDGTVVVVTDNDGVEDWSGETQLLRLGPLTGLFD